MKKIYAVFLLSLLPVFAFFYLAQAGATSDIKLNVNIAEVINTYIYENNLIIETNSPKPLVVFDKQKNSRESFSEKIILPISQETEYTIIGSL